MGTKVWTLQTTIEQLRIKVHEALDADILDPHSAVRNMELGDVLDELRDYEFSKDFGELPGQTALQVGNSVDDPTEGTTAKKQLKDLKDPKDPKGTENREDE